MKPSQIKKDKMTTIRFNSEVMEKLNEMGYKSAQDFFNKMLDRTIDIEIVDPQLIDNK